MNFLILIDGPKGSGKTTLCELLKERLENTEFLGLDIERKVLIERTSSISEDNRRASQFLIEKLKAIFMEKKNAVIDSGLSEERIKILEKIAEDYHVKVHKFALNASYQTLSDRVSDRDQSKGKDFDKNRFDYTFNVQQSKSFAGFRVIDSSKLSPKEIGDIVIGSLYPDAQ